MPELQCLQGRIHVVTADKELCKRIVKECNNSNNDSDDENNKKKKIKLNGGNFIHPPKFWKQYLPNLRQQQQQQ